MSNWDISYSSEEPQLYCQWNSYETLLNQALKHFRSLSANDASTGLNRIFDPLYFEYRRAPIIGFEYRRLCRHLQCKIDRAHEY